LSAQDEEKQADGGDESAEAEAAPAAKAAPKEVAAEQQDSDPRPYFARAYPKNAELEALVAAFDRGDYATVRTDAPALAARAGDPAVKRAAEDLARRIQPDSLSAALVVIGAGLLLFLVYTYWGHAPHDDHNAPAPSGPAPTAPAPRRSAEAPR
jgi:hypothetical protein